MIRIIAILSCFAITSGCLYEAVGGGAVEYNGGFPSNGGSAGEFFVPDAGPPTENTGQCCEQAILECR